MNYFWGFVCIFIYVDVLLMLMFENFEIFKFVYFLKLICGFLCVCFMCVLQLQLQLYVNMLKDLMVYLMFLQIKKNDCIMYYQIRKRNIFLFNRQIILYIFYLKFFVYLSVY